MSSTINTEIRERSCILKLASHFSIYSIGLKGLLFVELRELGIQSINLLSGNIRLEYFISEKTEKENVPWLRLR